MAMAIIGDVQYCNTSLNHYENVHKKGNYNHNTNLSTTIVMYFFT